MWELPDLLDALVVVGELDQAEALAARWEHLARRLGRAWALAISKRTRALVRATSTSTARHSRVNTSSTVRSRIRRPSSSRSAMKSIHHCSFGRLGRAGATFACDLESVVPDVYILGKALGGRIVPLSAVAADADVLGVLTPGSHGSTFGGNPVACAVGRAVIRLLQTGEPQKRAADLETTLSDGLMPLLGSGLLEVRTRGLWAGIDLDPALGTGRDLCEALAERGVLAKDTHGSTARLSPPLTIETADLEWGLEQVRDAVRALNDQRPSTPNHLAPPSDRPASRTTD